MARAIHGLARRRPEHESTEFGRREFGALYKAVAFANLQTMALNTAVTVSWSTVGITDDAQTAGAHKALPRRIREWCVARKTPIPFGLIWVKERSVRMGLHSHLLVHMPSRHRPRFGAMVKEAVEKIAERPVMVNHLFEGKERSVRSMSTGLGQPSRPRKTSAGFNGGVSVTS